MTISFLPILDPKTMQVVEGEIEQQTKQALDNLKEVLEAAGSSMPKVIKTTVFLKVKIFNWQFSVMSFNERRNDCYGD